MTHRPHWQKMTTPQLLEHAWALVEDDHESPTATCIRVLAARLRSAEEWIDRQARRHREAQMGQGPVFTPESTELERL